MPTENQTHFSRSQALAALFQAMREPERPNLVAAEEAARSALAPLDFTDEELYALAVLLDATCNGRGFLSGARMMQAAIFDPTDRVFGAMILFKMMSEGTIIRKGENLMDDETRRELAVMMSPAEYYEAPFEIGPSLLQILLDMDQNEDEASPVRPYETNEEYLEDWYRRVSILSEIKGNVRLGAAMGRSNKSEDPRQNLRYKLHVRNMTARKEATEKLFPLDELATECGLDEFETELLTYLVKCDVQLEHVQVSNIAETLAGSTADAVRIRSLLEVGSKLRSRGILEVEHDAEQVMGHLDIEIAPHVMDRLYERSNSGNALDRLLSRQSYFKLVHPTQRMEDVVLPNGTTSAIRNAIARYQPDVYARLKEWGLVQQSDAIKPGEKDEAPLRMLFFGASGTGKTLTALALANQIGRPVLVTDVSKILGCWVGESEKNVKRLLDLHSRIIRSCDQPPVLFLNECDQLLQRRDFGGRGVDRMYNQMMTLWLEGLENMRGIVIATTNITDNIDEAFSRRFHLKLEFGKPDAVARRALWQKHLKPTIPLAEDIDVNYLAESFGFTGGQIAIVVEVAATEAALRGDHLTMADLTSASETEARGELSPNRTLKDKVGF